MKKYCVLVGLLLAGTGFLFAAEEMQFQTTLSAPIAVFDKVEATNAAQYAVAEKATIGVLTRDSKGINADVTLKGHDARLASLELTSRTNLKSNNVPIWKTPKMTLRPGGTVRGKQLLLKRLNLHENNVHQVKATDGEIRIKQATDLKSAAAKNMLQMKLQRLCNLHILSITKIKKKNKSFSATHGLVHMGLCVKKHVCYPVKT